MTYQQKLRENNRLLENYVAFLPECTSYEQRLKLSSEIGRLQEQKEQIQKMPYGETLRDISDWKIQANAVLRDMNPINMDKIIYLKKSLAKNPKLHHLKESLAHERKYKKRAGAIALLEKAITAAENNQTVHNPVKPLPTFKRRKTKTQV